MTEIGFYHLTRSTAEQALPALLGRTLAADRRAVVRLRDAARVELVDAALWRVAEPVWLPHGAAARLSDGKAVVDDAALQPIWVTDGPEVPNGATYLFLLDGLSADDAGHFERVFDLFDGSDPDSLAAARLRWTASKTAGHGVAYWRQEPKGWVKAG